MTKFWEKLKIPFFYGPSPSHGRKVSRILQSTLFVQITIQKPDRGYLSPFSTKKFQTYRVKKVTLARILEQFWLKKGLTVLVESLNIGEVDLVYYLKTNTSNDLPDGLDVQSRARQSTSTKKYKKKIPRPRTKYRVQSAMMQGGTKKYKYKDRVQGRTNLKITLYFAEPWYRD